MNSNCAVLLLFAFVAAAHAGIFIQDGQEYEYDSTVTMIAGTLDHAPHASGTVYTMKVRLQTQGHNLNFEISNVKMSQYVGPISMKVGTPLDSLKFTDLAVQPMSFSVKLDDDGKFASISHSSSLTLFQRNLIRGWASQMQINSGEIKRGNRAFVSHEKTIHGDCDITYTVTDDLVLKNVAHSRDCKKMVYRMVDDWRGHRCDLSHHEHDHHDHHENDHTHFDPETRQEGTDGLFSKSSTAFQLEKTSSGYLIKSIQATGALVGQFFKTEGVSHVVYFNQTSILTSQKSSGGDIAGGDASEDNLEYEFDDAGYKWNVDRDLKAREPFYSSGDVFEDDQEILKIALKKGLDKQKEILLSHENTDLEVIRETHMKGLQTLYPILFGMNYDSLKSLADEFLADKSDSGVMRSNIFLELLGSTGSSASALLVRDLYLEKKFDNSRDATRVLTSVPFHIRRPNTQLVQEFEKLLTSDSYSNYGQFAVPLMFGHLVRMTCERALDQAPECFRTFASKYVETYWNKYKSSTDRDEKSLILNVLGNIRYGGVAESLKPLIYGQMEGETVEMRSQAVFSAGYEALTMNQGVNYFFPVFADKNNNHEIRLSAITMIMYSHPSATDFARIASLIKMEKDYEVINYVFTLLKKFATSINPCDHETSKLAEYFIKYLEQMTQYQVSLGLGVSKVWQMQFHKEKFGYSGFSDFYTFGSHKSFTPIRIGFMVGTNLFDSYNSNMFGVHLRVEGLAKGIVRKFKNMDPTVWKTADLKGIFDSMNIEEKPDQPIRVAIIITLKGTAVIHRTYDENVSGKGGKIAKILEGLTNMDDTYSINHQRVLQLGSLMYEQPSDLGIPMVFMNSLTSMVHLTATVKRGILRGLIFRDVQYDLNLFSQGTSVMGFINPARGARYGIIQDRIYHAHFPRKFVLGLNPSRKELKLTIERPSFEEPMSLMMHSVTVVAAIGKKLGSEPQDLKSHCPSCSNFVVVSKGPSAATNRVFVDKECDKGGYYMKGEYFDCELDVSKRMTVRKALYAFSPYNKNPHNMATGILMGLRQIRAFFLYFPKAEKCGASFRFSQSENNPVKEIEISLRAQVEDNGERLFFHGRKWLVRVYIKGKGDPAPRAWRVSLSYDYTPGFIQNKFKLMVNRAPVPGLNIAPYTVCFSYDSKYPDFHEEFMGVDFNEDLETSGKAMIQYGEGSECEEVGGEMKATFKHSTTSEGKEALKSKWYYKKCMEDKSNPAWAGRAAMALPISEACYKTAWDATNARKYTWNIQFTKITNRMSNFISKIHTLVKAGLVPFWDMDPEEVTSDSKSGPFMNIELKFHDQDHLLDMKMETSQGVNEVKDYPLQLEYSYILRNLKFTKTIKRLMTYGILSPCVTTMNSVRTLDNSTYSYDLDSCWTLFSGHCSPNPSYAVFLKKVNARQPVAAKIYLGGHEIEFDPSGGSMRVSVNGAAISVQDQVESTHSEAGTEIFKIFRWGSTYNVYSTLKVWVVYDGNFAEVIPAPSVTGQHCGMCGNYNRNRFDDLTGKQGQKLSAELMAPEWKWKC